MESSAVIALILFFVGLAAIVAVPVLIFKKKKIDERLNKSEKGRRDLEEQVADLIRTLDPLLPLQGIVDAKAEADSILKAARKSAYTLEQEASQSKEAAEKQAAELLSSARKGAQGLREKAQGTLDEAKQEAQRILDSARARAESIAGDAFKAKENAELYEKAARAMKNIIDGYGDEYLVPNRSLLDDLAEDFGHKEAGEKLKGARAHTRSMIKNGIAAKCDYVAQDKLNTALRFVLDAFNGKVDMTLAKVKYDNFGKLKQEILDAYGLVNQTGKAFRDARIEPDYLAARLEELKWAVATLELKKEEQEEQRRIQELIREEEKARRDFEKAMKQAAKEEKMLQEAMDKARKEMGDATEEQRARLEQQLQELQQKLEEAEARNQRAISMAQQTKRGHVYVISNIGSFGEDVFKIGLTRRLEPLDRVRELGDASVPFPFDVHAMIYSEDAPALESELHRTFQESQMNKVNPRKEFFQTGLHAIRETLDGMSIEAHWTMKAEAMEYRESLAMAKSADIEPLVAEAG
ncbi:DUF4041 domain-containing protein [Desulfovibrio subterraneus]|uniref:Chromosome segregation ATPase n=1 Tax=Desulfovibrio subterraneus TaxID=2718620 RepID=A0A7J0BHT3_9BACT|nr:DUF4041 domain-containing protein [Desulfovibrio subterraneus]GFM33269.1 chromosome segregation ATPase [Desulfovibrio subterraneus]